MIKLFYFPLFGAFPAPPSGFDFTCMADCGKGNARQGNPLKSCGKPKRHGFCGRLPPDFIGLVRGRYLTAWTGSSFAQENQDRRRGGCEIRGTGRAVKREGQEEYNRKNAWLKGAGGDITGRQAQKSPGCDAQSFGAVICQ